MMYPSPVLISAVALAALASLAARAESGTQGLGSIEDVSLEELLGGETSVASTKAVKLRASPGIVTMVTRDEIRRLGARDLADLLPMVPGFELGTDVSGVVGIGFRGIWGHEGKVLVMVDGIEMNETHYLTTSLLAHFPLDDVERIEILRGPGSARYGGTAELAVINIITRSGAEKGGVGAELAYAHMTTPFDNGSVGATVGHLLPHLGGLDLSLHASFAQRNTSDRSYTDLQGSGFDMAASAANRTLWLNAAASAPWLKVRLIVDTHEVIDRTGYDVIQERAAPVGFPAAYLDVSVPMQASATLSVTPRLVLQRQLPWWCFVEDGTAVPTRFVNDRARAQLNVAWEAIPTMALAGGLEAYVDASREIPQGSQDRALDYVDTQLVGPNTTNYGNGALWGEAVIDTSLFTLTTGARAETHSAYGPSFVPRVALTRVFDRGHAKLLVSGAFKAPAIANISLTPTIRPERTRVLEAEVGAELVDQTYLTANAFDIEILDPIVYFFDEATQTENYANFPRTGSRGIEVGAVWAPGFGRFDLSWTFATAGGLNTVDLYAIPGDTSRLLGMPLHKLVVSTALFLSDQVTITPSIILRSERGAVLSVDADGNSVVEDLPASALVNVFLDVRDIVPGLDFGLGVRNLLDEQFQIAQPYDSQHAPLPVFDRELQARIGGTFPL